MSQTTCGHNWTAESARRGKCAACYTAQVRARRGERELIYRAKYGKQKYGARRVFIDSMKNVPCADCGESYPPYVMHFDHLNPPEKRQSIGRMTTGYSLEAIRLEAAKCEVVCANCHAERTHQRRMAQV